MNFYSNDSAKLWNFCWISVTILLVFCCSIQKQNDERFMYIYLSFRDFINTPPLPLNKRQCRFLGQMLKAHIFLAKLELKKKWRKKKKQIENQEII